VQLSVDEVLHFVVQRVQEVGSELAGALHSATAALACPTIEEARAKKFEYIPSEWHAPQGAWQVGCLKGRQHSRARPRCGTGHRQALLPPSYVDPCLCLPPNSNKACTFELTEDGSAAGPTQPLLPYQQHPGASRHGTNFPLLPNRNKAHVSVLLVPHSFCFLTTSATSASREGHSLRTTPPTYTRCTNVQLSLAGKERWRHHSQHLAKEADAARVRGLAACHWDCSRFGAFVALANALLLSQMVELARLATSVATHQVCMCMCVCVCDGKFVGLFAWMS